MNGRLIRLMSALAAVAVLPLAATAQQATITGTVRSDIGDPLRYANVVIVGQCYRLSSTIWASCTPAPSARWRSSVPNR